MKDGPLFSVVVGTYNSSATLPRLLDSLIGQTFTDFELLVADDGSTDKTLELVKGFDLKATVTTQKNRGMRLAKSLNRCLKMAKGQYCLLIMGDSFLETDYLEVLSKWVRPYRLINGIRLIVEGDRGVDFDWRLKKGIIPETNALLSGQPWGMTTGNGLCIPTEAFRKHGWLDEDCEGYGGEDTEIVARLFFKGYTIWSVTDLKLYHNYHHTVGKGNVKNQKLVIGKIEKYAS